MPVSCYRYASFFSLQKIRPFLTKEMLETDNRYRIFFFFMGTNRNSYINFLMVCCTLSLAGLKSLDHDTNKTLE